MRISSLLLKMKTATCAKRIGYFALKQSIENGRTLKQEILQDLSSHSWQKSKRLDDRRVLLSLVRTIDKTLAESERTLGEFTRSNPDLVDAWLQEERASKHT